MDVAVHLREQVARAGLSIVLQGLLPVPPQAFTYGGVLRHQQLLGAGRCERVGGHGPVVVPPGIVHDHGMDLLPTFLEQVVGRDQVTVAWVWGLLVMAENVVPVVGKPGCGAGVVAGDTRPNVAHDGL